MKVTLGKKPEMTPNLTKFNIEDEFKLNYRFPEGDKLIPLNLFNLTIEYYTKGNPEKFIAIMEDGNGIQNCITDHETGTLKVIFENHNLKPGYLFAKFIFEFEDEDMADKKATTIKIDPTNILLIDNLYL